MYEQILVPTDGSETAERAMEHALVLSERFDATIHVLGAIDPASIGSGPIESGTVESAVDAVKSAAERAVARLADEARVADVPVVEETRVGPPHRTITDYVDEVKIDLVVMGTHGRSGLDRALLGSVTERVLRTSSVPVLAVGPENASSDR